MCMSVWLCFLLVCGLPCLDSKYTLDGANYHCKNLVSPSKLNNLPSPCKTLFKSVLCQFASWLLRSWQATNPKAKMNNAGASAEAFWWCATWKICYWRGAATEIFRWKAAGFSSTSWEGFERHQRPSIGLIDYKIKAADGSLRMCLLQCGLKINKMYMSL